MKKRQLITLAVAAVVIIALLVVAKVTGNGDVTGTFWSLVPALIAIVLALITKEVYSSLFIGILSAAILASNFSFAGTMDRLIYFEKVFDSIGCGFTIYSFFSVDLNADGTQDRDCEKSFKRNFVTIFSPRFFVRKRFFTAIR